MVDSGVPTAAVPAVPDVTSPSATTPRVVPTVSQPIRVDWGSWAEQFLVHETAMIETGVNLGIGAAETLIPGGFMIKMFVGTQVVDGLIEQGLKVLEGILDKQAITVSGSNPLVAYVVNMMNATVPNLATALGPRLNDLVTAGLAKAGLKV